ncbi:MAG: hypothetical protein H6754_07580 [Candidatus Omnitrophica bacterium]|nr:hypothetical protein [Candidatus Omnitrophota bacterium]
MISRAYLTHNRYEHALNSSPWAEPEVQSIFSGASRSTRLSQVYPDIHRQVIWDTGTNVIGPLFTTFVWWLLQQAKKDGIKRLYFMARDGFILKEIADILIPTGNFEIETRYLQVSRQSLLYASIKDVDTFDTRWLMWNPLTPLSVKTILQRLEIMPDMVSAELNKYGIQNIDKLLTLSQKWKFRSFFSEPKVKKLILQRAQERFVTTDAYLRQEGLTDGTSFALVDLGWAALSQYALSRLLEKSNGRPSTGVKGYYLGNTWLLWRYRNDTVKSFLFEPSNLISRIALVQYELPEIFAKVDQGRTVAYTQNNGKIVPILDAASPKFTTWGIDIQKNSVLAFTKEVATVLPKHFWQSVSPTSAAGKIFKLFSNWPSTAEAEVYGKFIHGADIEEKQSREVAPIVKFWDIPRIYSGYYWVQGCIVRSRIFPGSFFIAFFSFINFLRHWILLIIAQNAFPQKNHKESVHP